MKTMIAMMFLMGWAFGQSTTTVIDKQGNRTEISAVCSTNGDCTVWDSTNDEHLSLKETREKNKWCGAQHISKKYEGHGYADYNLRPSPCDLAWKQRKADGDKAK